MWFGKLTGFKEENPKQVRDNLIFKENKITSKINGAEFIYGELTVPTLKELKELSPKLDTYKSEIKLSELLGDVQEFHCLEENNGAFFQAASQFNLLEMVDPSVTPEEGIDIYEDDFTQGPACAIACGAGTIYRNYFVNVNGQIGQSSEKQIDCLNELGIALNNKKLGLWQMQNGYAMLNKKGLANITEQINTKSELEYEELKEKLRIGIQWETRVTLNNSRNRVSQAYCSALPVAYSDIDIELWEAFARLILEATYEATFYSALINYEKTKNNKVFLTLVGGGAFGNKFEWIFDAIEKNINKFKNTPLDVSIVSYGSSNNELLNLINKISN